MKKSCLKKLHRCYTTPSLFILVLLTLFNVSLLADTNSYSITLVEGNGTITENTLNVNVGSSVSLPDATCNLTDWTFAGWSTCPITSTTDAPSFAPSYYTPAANITLYAVYKKDVLSEQTITIDRNSIGNCSYGLHTCDVPVMNGNISTEEIISFEGYYAFTANCMELNRGVDQQYFGNTTPIAGLKSITLTSSTSCFSTVLEVYQNTTYRTKNYHYMGPIGELPENTTQTYNFTTGNGDYFLIQDAYNDYLGRLTSLDITTENIISTYNSEPANPVKATFNLTDEAMDIALSFCPTITFSEPITYLSTALTDNASLQAAITNGMITLTSNDVAVPFVASYANHTVTLTPQTAWTELSPYTISLDVEHISNSINTAQCTETSSLSFQTGSTLTRLTAPTNFKTRHVRAYDVQLQWNVVDGCTDHYEITIYKGDNFFQKYTTLDNKDYSNYTTTLKYFTIDNIDIDGEYTATIQAIGDNITTSNSFPTTTYFATNKLNIHDLTVKKLASNEIDVKWEADVNTHHASFNIHKKGDSYGSWPVFGATDHKFYSLTEGTTYIISAKGLGDDHAYLDSDPISIEVTTPIDCPISLNAGSGLVSNQSVYTFDGDIGLTPQLPNAVPTDNQWIFAGWSETPCDKQDTKPILIAEDYTPTSGATLYAVYECPGDVFTKVNTQEEFTEAGTYLFVNEKDQRYLTRYACQYGNDLYYSSRSIVINDEKITLDPIDQTYINWVPVKEYSPSNIFLGYSFHSKTKSPYYLSYSERENSDQTLSLQYNHPEMASIYDISITDGFLTMKDLSQTESDHYITYFSTKKSFADQSTASNTITLFKNSPVYAHSIADFEVNAYVNQSKTVLTQNSFATEVDLNALIPTIHSMTFMGWTENEITTDDEDNAPTYTTLPIWDNKTIYAVYQNDFNQYFYTTIPNLELIIDESGDIITNHSSDVFTSIVVNEDKSLDLDQITQVNTVTINPGARLTQNPSTIFSTEWLHFFGQDDHAPSLSIPKNTTLKTKMDYTMVIPDNSRYHFFSLPYTCLYDSIIVHGGARNNINIVAYHPENLANGSTQNWSNLSSGDTLHANIGYSIATDLEIGLSVTFTPANSIFTYCNDLSKTIALKAHKGTASEEFEGWNLVGSPYLDGINKSGYHKFSNLAFVSQPNYGDHCQTYTQRAVDETTIEAFGAYFVQVNANTTMSFALGNSAVAAASHWMDDRLKLSLSKGSGLSGQTDPTYIDVQTQYTTDYEIGYDLRKMLGQGTRPQFFSLSGSQQQEQRAFNALPETAMNSIPLGFYTGTTEQYTISADNASRYNAVHLYLTDLLNQVTTDLMITPYYFNGTAGELNTTRFVLNIVRYDTPTDFESATDYGVQIFSENGHLSLNNLVNGSKLDVLDATGKIIYSQEVKTTSLKIKAATGLYILRVTLSNGSFTTYKTLLK